MSLIKNKEKEKGSKVDLHLKVDESVVAEIREYLKWAEIDEAAHFIEEACRHVFETDGAWKQFKHDYLSAVGGEFVDQKETNIDIANQMIGEDEGMINLEDDQNLGRKLQKKNA